MEKAKPTQRDFSPHMQYIFVYCYSSNRFSWAAKAAIGSQQFRISCECVYMHTHVVRYVK